MEYKDYYATLGVDKKASQEEIQKAYRKLARKHHPDVSGDAGSEEKFKEITEAYEVLKDPEKRKTYDTFGKDWKQRGGPPPGWQSAQGGPGGVHFDFGGDAAGFSSFFDAIFGGGGARGGGGGGGGSPFSGFDFGGGGGGGFRPARNLDQEMTLALTLEEAARGGRREVSVHDPSTQERKTFTVNIPPGIGEGQKLRLKGKGGQGPGGQKGDLYIKIQLRPHERFRRDGRNLHAELPVAPWLAALGGEASVKTLNGSLKVKIPPGSSSGRKIRLKGKGFPDPRGKDGDLFAEIKVMVPESLSSEEKELFEKLQEVSSFRPR